MSIVIEPRTLQQIREKFSVYSKISGSNFILYFEI